PSAFGVERFGVFQHGLDLVGRQYALVADGVHERRHRGVKTFELEVRGVHGSPRCASPANAAGQSKVPPGACPCYARSMPAPILRVEDLPPLLTQRGSLMALDLGTKTIGLAVSDDDRFVATPLKTLARRKFGLDAR